MPRLVLASASPRRRRLLAALGVEFDCKPADVPEIPQAGENPPSFAARVARAKVDAVAKLSPGCWILGADTVVAVDEEILGKPRDDAEARRMLRRLSGRVHRVLTAVVLRTPEGTPVLDAVAATTVAFRALGADEVEAYVATGEARDKAGAYAVQGGAAAFVIGTDGSYTNVVGLPMELVEPALRHAGLLAVADTPAAGGVRDPATERQRAPADPTADEREEP